MVDVDPRARNNFSSYIDLFEGHGINACPVQEEGMEKHFMHHLYTNVQPCPKVAYR